MTPDLNASLSRRGLTFPWQVTAWLSWPNGRSFLYSDIYSSAKNFWKKSVALKNGGRWTKYQPLALTFSIFLVKTMQEHPVNHVRCQRLIPASKAQDLKGLISCNLTSSNRKGQKKRQGVHCARGTILEGSHEGDRPKYWITGLECSNVLGAKQTRSLMWKDISQLVCSDRHCTSSPHRPGNHTYWQANSQLAEVL